jgi:hypothetical protein
MGMLVAAVAFAASMFQPGAAQAERTPAAAGPRPQTLYSMSQGTIQAFAQDGPLLTWFAPSTNACNAVYAMSLSNGVRVQLPDESPGSPNVTCRWEVVKPPGLAVAYPSADVLWTLREAGPVPFDYVLGAGGSDPRERRFKEVAHASKGPGLWLGGISGNGDTLVYGVTNVAYVDEVACLSGGSCEMKVGGGGVYRVVGRKPPVALVEGRGAVHVAASQSAVAYVPAASIGKLGMPTAGSETPIEIRDAKTGAQVARAMPQGTPVAISLSDSVLASLERTPLGMGILWYDASTGKRLGSVPVPAGTAPQLSATDRLIVFRVGRSIRSVNVESHKLTALVRAAATPIGLSLEGSRVAWAENVKGRGRIRAVYVKGRG